MHRLSVLSLLSVFSLQAISLIKSTIITNLPFGIFSVVTTAVDYVADQIRRASNGIVTTACTMDISGPTLNRRVHNRCVCRRDVTPERLSLSRCRACVTDSRQEVKSEGRLSDSSSMADGLVLSDGFNTRQ